MQEKTAIKKIPASFRDPVAQVYIVNGAIKRVIRPEYFPEYSHFMEKVYPALIECKLIIPHTEEWNDTESISIKPDFVPFISYPYEWSFSMLKEAALAMLRINEIARWNGMMLKDAPAYNMVPHKGKMKLIDTTSFMFYDGNTPWPSYAQFLRHFVNPLLWTIYSSNKMRRLLEVFPDGIPVELTKNIIPLIKRLNPRTYMHIVTQSWAESRERKSRGDSKKVKMSKLALDALLNSLYKYVSNLNYKPSGRGWVNYENRGGSYSEDSLEVKRAIVGDLINPNETVLDIGGNTGYYSRVAAFKDCQVISIDSDHDCVEKLYKASMIHQVGVSRILPLVVDLCNPSPGIGWGNAERESFLGRIGRVDTILALALVHHLSIRNNVPLKMVADLLADHCKRLIIEWVPLEDKQAQRLLKGKNIPEYSEEVFGEAFYSRFDKIQRFPIEGTDRIIYSMEVLKW